MKKIIDKLTKIKHDKLLHFFYGTVISFIGVGIFGLWGLTLNYIENEKIFLSKLDALQEFTQGVLTSLQIHVGKDEWEKIVEELKNIEKTAGQSKQKENVEQPVEKRN